MKGSNREKKIKGRESSRGLKKCGSLLCSYVSFLPTFLNGLETVP